MTAAWLLLVASLGIILAGCDLFTNGVEWTGKRLRIAEGAVGSILAAVGTCLPETLIAILAIVLGERKGAGDDLGIGAILGAPLMLSTLAFFITGLAVLFYSYRGQRSRRIRVNHRVLGRDLRFFFGVFGLSAAATFLQRPARYAAALLLVALYAFYVQKTLADTRHPDSDEDISPLHFCRHGGEPPLWMIVGQSVLGLAVLVAGARLFVDKLLFIGHATGIPILVLSLILTPIATELPEKINSVLWVRQKKDTLALGNISGAMVFQSSIPTAIGMTFTKWELHPQAMASVIAALASSATVWVEMMWRRRISPWSLLMGGGFYAAWLLWTVVWKG